MTTFNPDNIRHALWILHEFIPSFNISRLAGPQNAGLRQQVMSALHGSKIAQSKCGINALQRDLFTAMGVDIKAVCLAEAHDQFVKACQHVAARTNW